MNTLSVFIYPVTQGFRRWNATDTARHSLFCFNSSQTYLSKTLSFQFQLILVLIVTHITHHHFITRLQATDHFYKLKVGIAQLHLALYDSLSELRTKSSYSPRPT